MESNGQCEMFSASARRVFRFVVRCAFVAIAAATFAVTASAAPSVDPLLARQIASAPLARTPVIITYNHQPTAGDFLTLRTLGITGGIALRQLPMVLTTINAAQLNALKSRPGVVSLYANRKMRLFDNKSRTFIGQTAARADAEVTAGNEGFRGIL